MSSTQKPADVMAERRSHWWWTVPGCLAMVLLNAAVSYGIVRLNAPVTVAFNMKQTVDAFFDRASQKQLSEAQSKRSQKPFQRVLTRHWKPACRRGSRNTTRSFWCRLLWYRGHRISPGKSSRILPGE